MLDGGLSFVDRRGHIRGMAIRELGRELGRAGEKQQNTELGSKCSRGPIPRTGPRSASRRPRERHTCVWCWQHGRSHAMHRQGQAGKQDTEYSLHCHSTLNTRCTASILKYRRIATSRRRTAMVAQHMNIMHDWVRLIGTKCTKCTYKVLRMHAVSPAFVSCPFLRNSRALPVYCVRYFRASCVQSASPCLHNCSHKLRVGQLYGSCLAFKPGAMARD